MAETPATRTPVAELLFGTADATPISTDELTPEWAFGFGADGMTATRRRF